MIERTEDCLGLCPERLAADSAYGSAEMLGWLVNERAIEPHIPVFDKSARDDGTFSRGDFSYNQESFIMWAFIVAVFLWIFFVIMPLVLAAGFTTKLFAE